MTTEIGPEHADAAAARADRDETQARRDVVDAVRAERHRLHHEFNEIIQLLDDGDVDAAVTRWTGLVRDVRDYAAAVERSTGFAMSDNVRGRLDATVGIATAGHPAPDAIRDVIASLREDLARQEQQLVPRLMRLPADERERLGDDFQRMAG